MGSGELAPELLGVTKVGPPGGEILGERDTDIDIVLDNDLVVVPVIVFDDEGESEPVFDVDFVPVVVIDCVFVFVGVGVILGVTVDVTDDERVFETVLVEEEVGELDLLELSVPVGV